MPKVSLPPLPVSALFAINKPSGPSSMSVINDVKTLLSSSRLFVDEEVLAKQQQQQQSTSKGDQKYHNKKRSGKRIPDVVKTGQGGTLDPLADGVLVVGVGRGTKKLSEFLDCVKDLEGEPMDFLDWSLPNVCIPFYYAIPGVPSKLSLRFEEYRTTGLLGCETDSYDSEGSQVRTAPWRHVTRESVEAALGAFRGDIQQTPPIFSALKMDGMPLYDYARKGIPLPRPIEKRPVTVRSLALVDWVEGGAHGWRWPEKKFTDEERLALEKALRGGGIVEGDEADGETVKDESKSEGEEAVDESSTPPAFTLTMTVSSGTYVRSLVHDIGHAVNSSAHVVTLTRSRQGRFALSPSVPVPVSEDSSKSSDDKGEDRGCVNWDVLERAVKEGPGTPGEDGWYEWEKEVMDKMEVV